LQKHSAQIAAKLQIKVNSVLAVTNPLGNSGDGRSVADYAADKEVLLWDRSHLIDHIWVDGIKALFNDNFFSCGNSNSQRL
jgi:hypothetical protein